MTTKIPTANQVLEQQRTEHGMPPKNTTTPAVIDKEAALDAFLLEHAGGGGATFFRFVKGTYRDRDGQEITAGRQFIVVYERIMGGWIQFHGRGQAPERKMGPILQGYVVPERNEIGDTDKKFWPVDPDGGEPVDPWQVQMVIPMLDAKTNEAYIFGTTSKSGRNSVGKLVAACRRLRKTSPSVYPVIRLDVGSFHNRNDERIVVPVPAFAIVGHVPKDGTSLPDTSLESDLNDEIPL